MPREAAKFWDRYVPELIRLGLATRLDEPALISMCEWWAIYRTLKKEISAIKPNDRQIYAAANARKQFDSIASRFGFTPADRARLAGAGKLKETGDKRERFLA
jgi:P27 family predicted phage terminase small subunit